MKTVSFLFLDHMIQKYEVQKSLCEIRKLSLLDFVEKIKQNKTGNFSSQIDAIIRTGAVIPNSLLDEFILHHLDINHSDNILISNYPRRYKQFAGFVKKIEDTDRVINTVFYVKQRNPDKYIQDYFSISENYAWLNKYGDEITLKWQEELHRKRNLIDELIMKCNDLIWCTIEVDYCVDLPKDCIRIQLAQEL